MQISNSSLKELSYKFGEYFSQKDIQGLSSLMDDNFSLYDPALKWVKGKDNVLEVLLEGFQAHKNVDYKTIEAFEDQSTTVLRFEIIMDEKKFVGVDFMRWKDEKMTELVCYYNPPEN